MTIEAARGDITVESVDAIVNAANGALLRGGGVCGAIFAAAGPELDTACAAIGSCATGDAVITPGFSPHGALDRAHGRTGVARR